MDFEQLANRYGQFYAPNYSILVDGEDIFKENLIEITNVTFEDTLEGADRFSFSLSDPGAKWLDSNLFNLGKEVEIKMGYGDKLNTMMVGEIISVRPSFPSSGAPQLEINGYDLSFQFTRQKRKRPYKDKKDSEMVAMIVEEAKHKLKANIEDTKIIHLMEKQESTDYEFIKKLAERNYFKFYVKEKEFFFGKPKKEKKEIVTLKYGESLLSFNPEINAANQIGGVKLVGWDPQKKKKIVGMAKRGSKEANERKKIGGSSMEDQMGKVEEHILNRPVFSQEQADNLALSILNRRSEGFIKGSAECIGIPKIKAGINVKLEGLGKKFSLKYYIESSTHTISNSGYNTSFNV